MRTTERMRGLKAFLTEKLCTGREMKAPAEGMDIGVIRRAEPGCWIGWAPSRMDRTGALTDAPLCDVPGILLMPVQSFNAFNDGRSSDRSNHVMRQQEYANNLSVTVLFSVYEPGIREPGFVQSVGERGQGLDLTKIREGTEEGYFTLQNWMDDCIAALLGAKVIPGTDLTLQEESLNSSLYTQDGYVVDKRPLYYGYVNVSFSCEVLSEVNPDINQYLF